MFSEVYKYFLCNNTITPRDEVCLELNLAFAMEGSLRTCKIKFVFLEVVRSPYDNH